MPALRVTRGGERREIAFERGTRLCDALAAGGLAQPLPCGGRGACGKCAAKLSGDASPMNEAERRAGTRLCCQAVLLGDCEAELPEERPMEVETGRGELGESDAPGPSAQTPASPALGAAIDVGTTTLALCLVSLADGRALATQAAVNPQTAFAADVMGRVSAAMSGKGEAMRRAVTDALARMLDAACREAGRSRADVRRLTVTGNAVMLYLLTGRDPAPLASAPFRAGCLFDLEGELLGAPVYYPPCAHAFVGADAVCAALAVGLCDGAETALLCDIGTNGELALWRGGELYVASTSAGPAFEGAGVVMGCPGVRGAIDRAWPEGGGVGARVIGGGKAVGVCGSGLIDAVAAYRTLERIAPDGATDEAELPLRDGVRLYPPDIRAVQLAKAAVAAGVETLLARAGAQARDVRRLYIAGGFGARLSLPSAVTIGLLPRELAARAVCAGNAALAGARLLLDPEPRARARTLAARARHVELGGDARFAEAFIRHMAFPAP